MSLPEADATRILREISAIPNEPHNLPSQSGADGEADLVHSAQPLADVGKVIPPLLESLAGHLGVRLTWATGPPPANVDSVNRASAPIVTDGGPVRHVLVERASKEVDVDLNGVAGRAARLISRMTELEHGLAHRVGELRAVYRVSSALTGLGDLESTMRIALQLMTEVMEVKAGAIRLLDDATNELVLRASVNVSSAYYSKGPIFAYESELDALALAGEVVYVADLRVDHRVRFPDLVVAEGFCSCLTTGLMFHGKPVGTIRLYSGELREFSSFEKSLFRTAAQQVAAAIVNARLIADRRQARTVRRQVALAGDVQRRMLPQSMPTVEGFDLAGRCLPSLELGGDFFDLIPLGPRLGLSVGDVVGKGVPAALMMASVRATLRAHALDRMRVCDVVARTNVALVHDTQPHEFATLWYGVLDPAAGQVTYCSAGHDPPLLLRTGPGNQSLQEPDLLDRGGTVLGIDVQSTFDEGEVAIERGDILVMYSDGLTDAMTFDGQRYGRERLIQAVRHAATLAEQLSASLVVNHVLWDVRRFVGLNRPSDDITLVVVCATG